jgi:hypothetical protein
VLGLRAVPDHATVWRFARHQVSLHLLDTALDKTVRRARGDVERTTQIAHSVSSASVPPYEPRGLARCS